MRIIAGEFRGRTLRAPKGMKTRPTTDRVREALFSILGNIGGDRVVDCFAGTGALGLEAISRGASFAAFVESGKEAAKAIDQNINQLGAKDRTLLLRCPVERCVGTLSKQSQFDLILADPPWPICHQAAIDVERLARVILKPGGTLVVGHPTSSPVELRPHQSDLPAASPPPLASSSGQVLFELESRRNWGDSGLSLFRRAETPSGTSEPLTE